MSGTQREANRRAIDKLQGGFRQYLEGQGPALGPPFVPAAPVAAVRGGVERQEQGDQRMNNIRGANVVTLKRPITEEAEGPNHFQPTS